MLAGVLNAFRRYFLAALAPVLLNVVLVGVLLWASLQQLRWCDIGHNDGSRCRGFRCGAASAACVWYCSSGLSIVAAECLD